MDEIQFIREIPSVVKYLIDHYKIKCILTGSSSIYLKNHFSESLSGRKFLFELMPLDFQEFLWFKNIKIRLDADYDLLRHVYSEYMTFGGLPGVVLEDDTLGKNLKLDDALGSYFQLDVANLSSFRDVKLLQSLLFMLTSRVGSKLDVTKLSQGLGVARQTLYNYLEFFEQTYLIRLAPSYSNSKDSIVRKVPKLFFLDTGLLNRVGKVSEGQVFENTVFNQLCVKNYFIDRTRIFEPRVYFFQKKSGAEIDFVTGNIGYETKLTGTKNDVDRLAKFARNLRLSGYFVVSLEKVKKETKGMIYPFNLSGENYS